MAEVYHGKILQYKTDIPTSSGHEAPVVQKTSRPKHFHLFRSTLLVPSNTGYVDLIRPVIDLPSDMDLNRYV